MKAFLVMLWISTIVVAACAANTPTATPPDKTQGPNIAGLNVRVNRSDDFGNVTPQQRQELMAQRLQLTIDACTGKAAGDACTITTPRGDRASTCTRQNETLRCGAFNRGNASRGAPPATST